MYRVKYQEKERLEKFSNPKSVIVPGEDLSGDEIKEKLANQTGCQKSEIELKEYEEI